MAKESNRAHIVANGKMLGQKGVVTLAGAYGQITLLGSDLKTSIQPGERADSFYVVPPEEKKDEGVVAVSVYSATGADRQMFLRVYARSDEKGLVIDDEEWVPFNNCLGNIINGEINVRFEGKLFTTSEKYARENKGYHVPDANLLCRFLNRKAQESDLINKISLHAQELSAIEERPELLARVAEQERNIRALTGKVNFFQEKLDRVYAKAKELEKVVKKKFFAGNLSYLVREIRNLANLDKTNEDDMEY